MGLLDGIDDPKRQFALMMASGLLANPGQNIGQGIGNALPQGLMAFNQGTLRQQKLAEEKQQQEMRAMAMAEMKRKQEYNNAFQITPGTPGVTPLTRNDDEGNPMPSIPAIAPQANWDALMRIDPRRALEDRQLFNKTEAPVPVAKGASLYDKATGRVVYRNEEPQSTFRMLTPQEAKSMGLPNNGQGYQIDDRTKKVSAVGSGPAAVVNVDNKQESAFASEIGKKNAENYNNLQVAGASAQGKLNKIERLGSLLSQSGNTGKLAPTTMQLAAAAESLGFKVDPNLPFQQAAVALSNEMALELRNPSGGAGMPGALSDSDREYLLAMVAGVAKTPEANKLMIDAAKKLSVREQQVAKLAREYKKKHGRFDDGFQDELAQFSAANPLFSAPAAGGQQGQPQTVLRFDKFGRPQ